MNKDLTKGSITKNLLLFALPLMAGNLLQQMYNLADTWIVGKFLGSRALAAVGSSYTLMVFLTSVFTGLCMGSGVAFAIYFGKKDIEQLKSGMSLLEKIIFVADYIEPSRKKAANLAEIRKLAFMDLDEALLKILGDTLVYLREKEDTIDPMTEKTYQYYLALFSEKQS